MIPAWSCALLIASCNTAQPVMPEPEPADLDDSRFPPDPDSPVMAPELKREAEYCVGFRGPADCPRDRCWWKPNLGGCQMAPCPALSVERCNRVDCEVMTGCNGEDQCIQRADPHPECGAEGYYAGGPCCPGLVRRCGFAVDGGVCDGYSEFHMPWCLPCGDGKCSGPLENKCSCPEDCK